MPGDRICWASGHRPRWTQGEKGPGGKRWPTEHDHHDSLASHGLRLWVLRKLKERERNVWGFLLKGEMGASVINWKNERDVFIVTAQVWEEFLPVVLNCYKSSSVINHRSTDSGYNRARVFCILAAASHHPLCFPDDIYSYFKPTSRRGGPQTMAESTLATPFPWPPRWDGQEATQAVRSWWQTRKTTQQT